MNSYLRAIWVYAFTLLKRFFRDKAALFFTIVFPLIFLLVFGGIFGSQQSLSFNVGLVSNTKTDFGAAFANQLKQIEVFNIKDVNDFEQAKVQIGRGELDAIIELPSEFGKSNSRGVPNGTLITFTDEADSQLRQTFLGTLQSVIDRANSEFVNNKTPLEIESRGLQTANLSSLDYLIPGLLGFSILSLGIFGLSNSIPSAKKEKILKRLKATPLTSTQLVLGIGLHYLIVGIFALTVMLLAAIVLFNFNMRGDYLSLFAFAVLSTITMVGFGLAIGGWAKNENQAAPLSNLIAFPMMFLSGVFFPRFLMPEWLQSASGLLPLSPIVDGFRFITAEGQTFFQLGSELGMLVAWSVVIYFVASKTFSWE